MPILNYTTSITAEKTIGEIQQMLAKAGATQILTEYDPEACVSAVNFRIPSPHGVISFRLPANVEAIQIIIQREKKLPQWKRDRAQATRVAWRIVKDWLEAQLALIACGMAEINQVFLPYAQHADGRTVYEALKDRKFDTLALM